MPKGIANKRYTPEFKQQVVEAVMQDGLIYTEAVKLYDVQGHERIQSWERIYLEEGPEGLAVERRGRRSVGRPKKLPSKVKEDLLAEVQRLRTENAYLKNLQALVLEERATPAQKAQVVQKLRQEFSLSLLREIAQLPRATFYYHLKQMRVPDKYKEVKAEITLIYHENKGQYGYRRITTELHNRGFSCNHKTVQRLMKELSLVCRVRIKKYRSYRGEVGKMNCTPIVIQKDLLECYAKEQGFTSCRHYTDDGYSGRNFAGVR